MPRRQISLSRVIAPIFGERRRVRTFHASRDYCLTSGGDDRPMNTVDQVVLVTVPWLRFAHPLGMRIRRIDL
jgi:hypothetical protein